MARTAFQTLEEYRLSEKLADQAWGLVCEWNALARDIVGKQLVRAADSVGANIAEGTGQLQGQQEVRPRRAGIAQ
ncbi:MAG: hypothetical protein JWO87_3213 [Phycisphaerales bacterium]|nr:hypothetical protein [Phycisphaerales bacterium]